MNISKAKILYKLAKHLQKPQEQLGSTQFDFESYGRIYKGGLSIGCAISEMPYCFPNEFDVEYCEPFESESNDKKMFFQGKKLVKNVMSIIHKETKLDLIEIDDGCAFFDINEDEYDHLFLPSDQESKIAHVNRLEETATKQEVSENIITFLVDYKGFSIEELEK